MFIQIYTLIQYHYQNYIIDTKVQL